jgi:hypothetical protein
MGCEGVAGFERGASSAAREAEDDDEDEAMAGDENIPMQEAVGGGGATAGIKKRKRSNRCKRLSNGQRQELTRRDRRLAADEASGS